MKSILLHVREDPGLESRISAAMDLARAFDAHITCLHATPYEDYLAVDPLVAAALPEEFSERMERLRLDLQARVEQRLRTERASWDWIHMDELTSTALIRHSIISDVVVISLPGGSSERGDAVALAGAVATGSRAPVLAIPNQFGPFDPSAPMLIAWNGSPEAAAAARAAIPLLKRAGNVYLLQVEEKLSRYPRDLIARHLSRHGIHVEVVQRRPIEGRIGLAIVETAAEKGVGLIVMGAYGHSRLREFLFGGVTRALLGQSSFPLLLGH